MAPAACGSGEATSGEEESRFERVSPSDRTYTLEDFAAAGSKKSNEYNVDGLAEAESACKGLWRPNTSSRADYELRFDPSHQAAVEAGAPLADEATGG